MDEEASPGRQSAKEANIPSVAILLCTMQGQEYLREQLDSIVGQTHPNWSLWVSDDGSTDGTHEILTEYAPKLGARKLVIKAGPAQGYVKNFLSLVCNSHITASYYAYSDQDDIWEPAKLSRALERLQKVPAHQPALYCGRTCNVSEDNQFVSLSPLFAKQPGFANALVQSIAGGNTMVFNRAPCARQRAPVGRVQQCVKQRSIGSARRHQVLWCLPSKPHGKPQAFGCSATKKI